MSISAILSELKIIAGAIYPPIRKKFFDQPKLYVALRKLGAGNKTNLGLSTNNEQKEEIINGKSIKYIDGNAALRFYQIERIFQLTLYNNSEHSAYKIKLLRPDLSHDCQIQPAINYLRPLKINDNDSFTLTFTNIHEATGNQSVEIFNTSFDYFHKNKVVVEYCNLKGTKFYTSFDFSKNEEERNSFHKKNPLS